MGKEANDGQYAQGRQRDIEFLLDRYGHINEIATMVAFVAGPESSYITGANLTVDGGMSA